jgi:alpha-glucosidase (family GH31 glycosyl hydrolase)
MRRYDWCSFTWDPEAFPDPKKYLSDIKKEYNVKVCAWITPYISEWTVTVTVTHRHRHCRSHGHRNPDLLAAIGFLVLENAFLTWFL